MTSCRHFLVASAFFSIAASLPAAAEPGASAGLFQQSSPNFNGLVELKTGYYVRADGMFVQENAPKISADGSHSNLKEINGWAFSVGAGSKLNEWMRADFTLDGRTGGKASEKSDPFKCLESIAQVSVLEDTDGDPATDTVPVPKLRKEEKSCQSASAASLSRLSALANVYLDLGDWGGFSPYIGAGAGVGYLRTKQSYDWVFASDGSRYAPNITKPVISPEAWVNDAGGAIATPTDIVLGQIDKRQSKKAKEFAPAFAIMAGVAYDISPNAKIDAGYRFMRTGGFANGSDKGAVTKAHEYRLGIRYMID